jgi:hypothetical protein
MVEGVIEEFAAYVSWLTTPDPLGAVDASFLLAPLSGPGYSTESPETVKTLVDLGRVLVGAGGFEPPTSAL